MGETSVSLEGDQSARIGRSEKTSLIQYSVPLQHKVWYKGYISQSLTAVGAHLP